MTAQEGSRRLIRKIVVGYELDSLPPSLMRSFTVLRAKVARKKLRIKVLILPISRLPEDVDVLFVSEKLIDKAQSRAPGAVRVAAIDPQKTYQAAYEQLLDDLRHGQDIYAEQTDRDGGIDEIGERGGIMMRYRGSERID